MLFVTTLDIIPGKAEEAIRLARNPQIPTGIKIREFLGMFGKPDLLLIFDAPDERTATQFVLQFSSVTEVKSSLAFPIEELRG